MENAQEILVIFLSTALAISLVLSIILLAICIKIAKHIKNISEKAELITDKAENIAEFMSSAATPLIMGKIITSFTEMIRGRSSKKKRRGST